MSPKTIEDIFKIRPLYEDSENECNVHIGRDYEFPDWRQLSLIVRVDTDHVDDERSREYEYIAEQCGCNPYGIQFLCAINPKTGEWIAFPCICIPIEGMEDSYRGNGDIEKCLMDIVGEKYNFDSRKELFCEKH